MRRLYLQIYLTVLSISILVMFIGAVIARHHRPEVDNVPPLVTGVALLIGQELPPPGAAPEELEAALIDVTERLEVDAELWGADGQRLANGLCE